jgi:diguanylate cyclase (GGDEF)-like protein/PAS domain S-box-containing protein
MQSEVPFEDNTFAVHTLPITNRDGFITGGMVMTQNITERARSETALRESEERFRLLFEHSPDAIWLLDPNRVANAWTIVDCNEAAARMHGYERDELIGQTMRFLDSQPTTPQQAAMQHESMWHTSHTSGEDYHRRKDGTLITIEYATVPIRLEGRDLILGVDRDVTVRKVAERDREQIIRQLQETLTRAEALFHTAQSLIATKNVEEVLQEVVDATVMALPADRVMLVTLDQDQRSVHHCVKGGPGAGALMPITFDELWEGLMGWALREREPVLSPKHAPDPRESVAARQQRDHSGCGAVMVAPLHYRGRLLGMLTAIERPDAPDFHTDDLDLLTAMANQAAVAIANAELFHEVNRIAITDELTDLYNRRGFVTMGEREVERSQRTQQPLTAIMVDVDHFKQVNDTYGHTAGDEVLRAIAKRCARNVRAVDILGRYGGEEFAILLPDTDLASAQQIAERLRECIATTPISTTSGPISITVSAGIALLKRGAGDLPALLHAADTALYAAKRAGRNSLIVQT